MKTQNRLHIKDNYSAANELNTDYRVEVVAASLLESVGDVDKILIFRDKANLRNTSKDIRKIGYAHLSEDFIEYLCLYTTRQGIYNHLPEGIFHQPHALNKQKSHEEIIDEIKDQRRDELVARRFFQPFEMAIDRILIEAQRYERKFNKISFHDNLKNVFTRYWPVFKLMDVRQAALFIRIIPELYCLNTDFTLTANVLSIIFDIPFKIELGKTSRIPFDSAIVPKLGKGKLGFNTVLVGETFTDGSRDICITIGPMLPEQTRLFLPTFQNGMLLKELLRLMLPVNYKRDIKLLTDKEQSKFRLSSDTHTAYLGINTILQ